MTELILAGLIVVILVYHSWYVRETNKRHKELVKAVMSKNLQEYQATDIMDTESKEVEPPDELPLEELDDSQFTKLIDKQVNG